MMLKRNRSLDKKQRGLVAVETAILVPVLLILSLAVGELGRAFFQYNSLNKAVRDGARFAATYANFGTTGSVNINQPGPGDQALDVSIVNLVVYGNALGLGDPLVSGLVPGQVQITVPGSGINPPPDKHIRVSASHAYVPMIRNVLPSSILGKPIDLQLSMSASVTIRAVL